MPKRIRVDNGTEFTSKALDHWAYWNHVELDFSRPGKPADNAFIEAFNGTLRRECLSQHWFTDLDEVQGVLGHWRDDYNNHRPHSAFRRGRRPCTGPEKLKPRTEANSMAAAREKGTTSSAWIVLGGQVTSVRLFEGIESTYRRVHLTTAVHLQGRV